MTKKTILTLALLALVTACNRTPANNLFAAQTNAGLPVPTERPATPPAPTAGADQSGLPAGLDCVRNRLTPDQRHAIAQAAMEQAGREDPRAQDLLQAVQACGSELSWSEQKQRLAAMFSMSAAGATGLRQEFASRGIRIEQLDQVILSDRELMSAADRGELSGTAGASFAQRHLDEIQQVAGGQSLDGELGTRIGNYIAFIALAQTLAAKFAREP